MAISEKEKLLNKELEINEKLTERYYSIMGLKQASDKRVAQYSDDYLFELDPELYRKENQKQVNNYLDLIQNNKTRKVISTGLNGLDSLLDGGFYDGLYILGAVSSLGKTSLVLQIADNIARSGNDVLYFSFEMSGFELYSRSLSRLGLDNGLRKTSREIMTGSFIDDDKERRAFLKAHELYCESIASNLFIIEVGIDEYNAEDIKKKVKDHMRLTNKNPVVIVDYLQIITPFDMKATDKQNIDKTVTSLKRLSRDHFLTVFVISSLNRKSYQDRITMDAFKESGAIEYSSDVLIGLQPEGKGLNNGKEQKEAQKLKQDEDFMKKKEKDMELIILKNRNGRVGKVTLNWKCLFNCWIEKKKRLMEDI